MLTLKHRWNPVPELGGISEALQSKGHEPSSQNSDSYLMRNLLVLQAQSMLPKLAGLCHLRNL